MRCRGGRSRWHLQSGDRSRQIALLGMQKTERDCHFRRMIGMTGVDSQPLCGRRIALLGPQPTETNRSTSMRLTIAEIDCQFEGGCGGYQITLTDG